MALGKRLLVFSDDEPKSLELLTAASDWNCLTTTAETLDQFRGFLQGGSFDLVLVKQSAALGKLISEADPQGEVLHLPLAEVEKRHIMRVLSSTGGNKTRAAKVLGIDTKTLYNKLKAYNAAAEASRRRETAMSQSEVG